jgi:tetratricopeptide (TPR) repeat protein
MRSYGLDLLATGNFLASLLILGGCAGVFAGGWFADRLGAGDRAWYARLPAIAWLITVPCWVFGLLAPNLWLAWPLLLLANGLNILWLGPLLTAVQHLVPQPMRSTAAGCFLLITNLVGLGVGPLLMGSLSDALKAIDHMDVRRHYLLFTPEGYAKAISGFESLLQKSPDEPLFLAGAAEAHAMLGRSLEMGGGTGKGHFETAMEYAQKAFSLDGSRFEVRRARAMGLYFNGQTGDARNEVDEAIQLCPNDTESYLLKAMVSENSEERARLYRKAISLNNSLSAIRLEPLIVPVPAIEKTRENYRARR